MAIVFSITPLAPATPPAALSSSSLDHHRRGAALLSLWASVHLQASLPLGSDPNFLPMCLSPSLRLATAPRKAPLPGLGFTLDRDPRGGHAGGAGAGGTVRSGCWQLVQVGALSQRPQHSGQLPGLRPLPAEGQPAGEGTEWFKSHPQRWKWHLAPFCKPLPEQAVDRTTLCLHRHHTNLSKHIMLGSQLSRKDPHSPQHVGVLSHQEGRCGIPPDKPTPQNRSILIQAGRGLAHTAHSRCSADFGQLITAKVSCDQPYPNSGSAQTSQAEGSLPRGPWTPPAAAGQSPGDARERGGGGDPSAGGVDPAHRQDRLLRLIRWRP